MIRRRKRQIIRKSPYGNQAIHSFKRTRLTTATVVVDGSSTESHGVFYFSLSDLQNYTEFQNLFDYYKITGIKMKWYPRINIGSTTEVTANYVMPSPLVLAVDQNDGTAVDYTGLIQYENAKTYSEYKPIKIYFKPKTYSSGDSQIGSNWLASDSGYAQVYYGLKWGTFPHAAGSSTTSRVWDIAITYYIKCKHPK